MPLTPCLEISSFYQELTVLQVHADASNFAANVTKEEAYRQVLESAELLFEGQRNWVCSQSSLHSSMSANTAPGLVRISLLLASSRGRVAEAEDSNLANTASLLWHAYKSLPAPLSEVNWAGKLPPCFHQTLPILLLLLFV